MKNEILKLKNNKFNKKNCKLFNKNNRLVSWYMSECS